MLAAQARTLLAAAYRTGLPRLHQLSLAEARHSFRKLLLGYSPRSAVSCREIALIRPCNAGGTLAARLHHPPVCGRLPVVLFLHGGGWALGDAQAYDAFCAELADASGAAVLALDYRLAPEHPFPAAVEDASFALDWLAAHAADLGLDPERIAVAGDSAGGNLAAVAALAARDAARPRLAMQLLIYPVVSQYFAGESMAAFGDGFLLDSDTLAWFQQMYLPDPELRADWRASALAALSFAGLPPTRLVLAQCDPLRDGGLAYAEALAADGVEVEVDEVAGMIHGFITMGRLFPQAAPVIERAGRALREVFG